MSEFIDKTVAENRELTEQWLTLIDNADPAELNAGPAPQSWSALECMRHVTITNKIYTDHLTKAIQRAKQSSRSGNAEYTPGFLGRMVLENTNPPPKRRMKTFKVLIPVIGYRDAAALKKEYLETKNGLLSVVASCEGVDIRKKLAASAFTKAVWLPIGLWIMFVSAHERRHLWQARQALERLKNRDRQ